MWTTEEHSINCTVPRCSVCPCTLNPTCPSYPTVPGGIVLWTSPCIPALERYSNPQSHLSILSCCTMWDRWDVPWTSHIHSGHPQSHLSILSCCTMWDRCDVPWTFHIHCDHPQSHLSILSCCTMWDRWDVPWTSHIHSGHPQSHLSTVIMYTSYSTVPPGTSVLNFLNVCSISKMKYMYMYINVYNSKKKLSTCKSSTLQFFYFPAVVKLTYIQKKKDKCVLVLFVSHLAVMREPCKDLLANLCVHLHIHIEEYTCTLHWHNSQRNTTYM